MIIIKWVSGKVKRVRSSRGETGVQKGCVIYPRPQVNNPKVPDPGLSDSGPQLTSNLSDLSDPAACLLVSSCWPWAWGTTWVLWCPVTDLSPLPSPWPRHWLPGVWSLPWAHCCESAFFVALIRGLLLQTSKLQLTWAACNPLAKL